MSGRASAPCVHRPRLRPACSRATDRRLSCAAGHSFDIARSGYVSLLQPQDRRSPPPGDTKEAVAARARLLDAGIGRDAIDAIVAAQPRTRTARSSPPTSAAARASSSARCRRARRRAAVGIDLSTAAAERAARRFPSLTWIVANVDRAAAAARRQRRIS